MKKILIFLIKLTVGLLLFKLIARNIDWKNCASILYTGRGALALLATTLLILLQYVLTGSKLLFLLRNIGTAIKPKDIIASQFLGNFCTQFGFSFASGDVARGYYLYKKYGGLRDISAAIFCDRVTGFIALSIFFTFAIIGIANTVQNHHILMYLYFLWAICFFIISSYLVLLFIPLSFKSKWLSRLSSFVAQNRRIFFAKKNVKPITSISFCVVLFNVLIIAVCGHILGLHLSLTSYFMITIPAILISMLPISIAGFGVRESSFVTGFSLLSNYGDFGLIISLVFGVSSILASLPGAIYLKKILSNHLEHPSAVVAIAGNIT